MVDLNILIKFALEIRLCTPFLIPSDKLTLNIPKEYLNPN